MTARLTAVLAGSLLFLGFAPAAVGDGARTIIRSVTMDGESRLAYYSVIEKRYVFLPETLAASAGDGREDATPEN